MYLPDTSWCMASVTLFGLKVKEIQEKKNHQSCERCRDLRRRRYKAPQKTGTVSSYIGATTVSELHNLLSHHHRPNGEDIQMPVDDIS